MSKQPEAPKWILRLLEWWVKRQYLEEIHGDLYELYEEQLEAGNPAKAKRAFIWNAIRFCRFSNFKKRHLNLYPMLWKNYTKVAWRQLLRDKLYAAINITGLAMGIASFLIVLFYVQTERSYDQHHPDKERLYRVSQNFVGENGVPLQLAYSYNPLSRTLEDHISIVEKTCRIFNVSAGRGESGGQFTNREDQIRYIK